MTRVARYLVLSAGMATASIAQQPMHVLLLPPTETGEATFAWDGRGTPIILNPITEATAHKLSALSGPRSCRGGVIYQATIRIDSLRRMDKWANGMGRDSMRADLLDVVRTYPTKRTDAELTALLIDAGLRGGELCRVDNAGRFQAIAKHKR